MERVISGKWDNIATWVGEHEVGVGSTSEHWIEPGFCLPTLKWVIKSSTYFHDPYFKIRVVSKQNWVYEKDDPTKNYAENRPTGAP